MRICIQTPVKKSWLTFSVTAKLAELLRWQIDRYILYAFNRRHSFFIFSQNLNALWRRADCGSLGEQGHASIWRSAVWSARPCRCVARHLTPSCPHRLFLRCVKVVCKCMAGGYHAKYQLLIRTIYFIQVAPVNSEQNWITFPETLREYKDNFQDMYLEDVKNPFF